ncbi:MAG: hypothetical protein V9G24_15030 [Rhodoblastus sp.]
MIEPRDAMAVQQREPPARIGGAHCGDEPAREELRRAPHDVIARQRIAVALHAALDPVDRRHEGHALRSQPVVDLAARMLDVMARPGQRPAVVVAKLAET